MLGFDVRVDYAEGYEVLPTIKAANSVGALVRAARLAQAWRGVRGLNVLYVYPLTPAGDRWLRPETRQEVRAAGKGQCRPLPLPRAQERAVTRRVEFDQYDHVRTWEAEDYRLELYDTFRVDRYGKSVLAYRFFHRGRPVFAGADFHCSPSTRWTPTPPWPACWPSCPSGPGTPTPTTSRATPPSSWRSPGRRARTWPSTSRSWNGGKGRTRNRLSSASINHTAGPTQRPACSVERL